MASARLIGLWAEEDGDGWPDVQTFVDPEADPADRAVIADRLDAGVRAGYAYMGYSACRVCGKLNGTGELTDGTPLWPEGLAHYIREHRVRLPAEVEEHLRQSAASGNDLKRVGGTEEDRDTAWWKSVTGGHA